MTPNESRRAEGGRRCRGLPPAAAENAPLVTVITVVLNGCETIRRCMESVFAQNYPSIEYIVIDGGSSDGTVGILQAQDDLLDYYVSQQDEGLYSAMNAGLNLARGSFILFLNSDDWYRPDAVRLLVEAAQRDRADIAHADAIAVSNSGREQRPIEVELNAGLFTTNMQVRHETMLVRKEVYERYGGYDDSFAIIADYAFTMRTYSAGCRFSHVRQRLLYFSMDGLSNVDLEGLYQERTRLFASLYPFLLQQDLHDIASGMMTNRRMIDLINAYPGRSELFVRSLATNVFNSVTFRLGEILLEPLARIARGSGRESPLRVLFKRWLYRRAESGGQDNGSS